MSTPASTIVVCSGTGLNNRYQHTVYHSSLMGQELWFAQRGVKTFEGYTYLRKNWEINVAARMDEAITWDYLYFKNYTKAYYYFITDVEYVNDATVRLSLELDVMQTYFFDYDRLPCHIDRQHTETDAIGDNLTDEGLEVGELININYVTPTHLKELCILVLSSIALENPPENPETAVYTNALSAMYGNTFSGLWIYAIDPKDFGVWSRYLDGLSRAGRIDAIVSMWMYPKALVSLTNGYAWGDEYCCKLVNGTKQVDFNQNPVPTQLGDYVNVRNNKMFTYPYCFMYVSNNNGGSAVYRFERFHNNEPKFRLDGSITPDGGARLMPKNYNWAGTLNNYGYHNNEEGLSLLGYPTCTWDCDTYKVWLAQNQNQNKLAMDTANIKVAGGIVSGVLGMATGSFGVGAGSLATAGSGIMDVLQHKAAVADMSITPPQARGALSSSVTTAIGMQGFSFYIKCPDYQHCKQIDDFFTMYGYKINRIGVPNINAREGYTYVKTIGCNIKSNLNAADAAKICDIYDRGITFWKTTIGNYDHPNKPLN